MSALVIATAYAAGWLVAAPIATRVLAPIVYCRRGSSRYWCRKLHRDDCQSPLGVTWFTAALGSVLALAWLLLAPVALTWFLASRGVRSVAVDLDAEIAAAEREAGIR